MGKIDGNLFRIKIGTVNIGATNSVTFTLKKDYQKTTNQDSAGWDELHATAGVRGRRQEALLSRGDPPLHERQHPRVGPPRPACGGAEPR